MAKRPAVLRLDKRGRVWDLKDNPWSGIKKIGTTLGFLNKYTKKSKVMCILCNPLKKCPCPCPCPCCKDSMHFLFSGLLNKSEILQ